MVKENYSNSKDRKSEIAKCDLDFVSKNKNKIKIKINKNKNKNKDK